MPLIVWNDSLSVGIAEFDTQHKKLIGMINKLNDAMREGKSKTILSSLLAALADYTVEHFSAEEKLMDSRGYPQAGTHKIEHQRLIAKVNELRQKDETGQLAVSIEVMNFLKDWLQTHIQGTDKKYSTFFGEKGIRQTRCGNRLSCTPSWLAEAFL